MHLQVTNSIDLIAQNAGSHLPLLPQSAQEMSSSGFFSRFCSFVPRQKLQIGIGSATGCGGRRRIIEIFINCIIFAKHILNEDIRAEIANSGQKYRDISNSFPRAVLENQIYKQGAK